MSSAQLYATAPKGRLPMRSLQQLLPLIFIALGQMQSAEKVTVVTWEDGNEYSSTFLYNGYRYKTIRVSDSDNPAFSLTLSVARAGTLPCSGGAGLFQTWIKCAAALVDVRNEGTVLLDIDPTVYRCNCAERKPKTLQYRLLQNLRSAQPSAFLLGNTLVPEKRIAGIVTFDGNCSADSRVFVLPISFGGKPVEFVFPFE
jgi:hypothetical protein